MSNISNMIENLKLGRRALFGRLMGGAVAGAVLPRVAEAQNAPADNSGVKVQLVAAFVSDLDKSVKFYEALGFTSRTGGGKLPPAVLKLYEIDTGISAHIMAKDGYTLELLAFDDKKLFKRNTLDHYGFSHFTLFVQDLDKVMGDIKKLGGAVMDSSLTKMDPAGKSWVVFCTDPDGCRIGIIGPHKA